MRECVCVHAYANVLMVRAEATLNSIGENDFATYFHYHQPGPAQGGVHIRPRVWSGQHARRGVQLCGKAHRRRCVQQRFAVVSVVSVVLVLFLFLYVMMFELLNKDCLLFFLTLSLSFSLSLYRSIMFPDVLKGYNGTIFAYGQTSSGKTHTMEVGKSNCMKASSFLLRTFERTCVVPKRKMQSGLLNPKVCPLFTCTHAHIHPPHI